MNGQNAKESPVPILVTGGTGIIGRLVVNRLVNAGQHVRILSRAAADQGDAADRIEYAVGDLATGDGVDAAVGGTEIIVHLAGTSKGDEVKARNLVEAASRALTRHIVYISVVGDEAIPIVSAVDRAMFGYFASKQAAGRIIAGSGISWTTLHATQVHDLAFKTAEAMAKLPVIPVPAGFRFQPIDADEVAARLVELALGEPAGLVPDLGGPRIYDMADLVRSYLQATGKHRLIVSMPTPGASARAVRDGANLAPERAVGHRTWEQFLADRVATAGASAITEGS